MVHQPGLTFSGNYWVCVACGEKRRSSAEPKLCDCGLFGSFILSGDRKTEPDHIEPEPAPETRSLDDVPAVADTHSTGIRELDDVLSGGIPDEVPGLVYGPSYSGKSTLAIQIAASLPGPQLIVCPEMAPRMLRTIAERSGADFRRFRLYDGQSLEAWPTAAGYEGARVVVLDSVDKFFDPRGALDQAVRWAHETGGIILCISHESRRAKPLRRSEYEPDLVIRVTRTNTTQKLDIQKARWNGYRGAVLLKSRPFAVSHGAAAKRPVTGSPRAPWRKNGKG